MGSICGGGEGGGGRRVFKHKIIRKENSRLYLFIAFLIPFILQTVHYLDKLKRALAKGLEVQEEKPKRSNFSWRRLSKASGGGKSSRKGSSKSPAPGAVENHYSALTNANGIPLDQEALIGSNSAVDMEMKELDVEVRRLVESSCSKRVGRKHSLWIVLVFFLLGFCFLEIA